MLGDFEIEIHALNAPESFYFRLLDFRPNGVKDPQNNFKVYKGQLTAILHHCSVILTTCDHCWALTL